MNNWKSSLMFATAISCISLGCSQTNTSSLSQTPETTQDNQSNDFDSRQTVSLKWLFYADPKVDANLAIEKQDFTLLAFAGRVTSFPGIDIGSTILQQQCGYRLLANSSDALRSENELNLRKKLYQYAATFNQLVSAACRGHNLSENN
jgi:hypothetical protein